MASVPLDADEFWQHADYPGTDGGIVELQREFNLGNTGWGVNTEYEFDFIFTPTNLKVYVDDILEINIAGSFSDGRLGFYNFSQGGVIYSSFTVDEAPEPGTTIPEPATLLLLGAGLLGIAGLRKKLK